MISPLHKQLVQEIRLNGPISCADFMNSALFDPRYGYYQQPKQQQKIIIGDFITAPEITPLFGEIIAGWLLINRQQQQAIKKWLLVEIGAGRGLLLYDICKTIKKVMPSMCNHIEIHIIEKSYMLQKIQKEKLYSLQQDYPQQYWYNTIESFHDKILDRDISNDFISFFANELFDCFGCQQMIYQQHQWYERRISVNDNDEFIYVACDDIKQLVHHIPQSLKEPTSDNTIIMLPLQQKYMIQKFAEIMQQCQCHFLIIDYGDIVWQYGDTMQAIYKHQKVSPFDHIGNTDITIRVNFAAMTESWSNYGIHHSNITTQADFLHQFGLLQRIEYLAKHNPHDAKKLYSIYHRLCDDTMMGKLFKVVVAYHAAKKPIL